jgi:hypothetical protein
MLTVSIDCFCWDIASVRVVLYALIGIVIGGYCTIDMLQQGLCTVQILKGRLPSLALKFVNIHGVIRLGVIRV